MFQVRRKESKEGEKVKKMGEEIVNNLYKVVRVEKDGFYSVSLPIAGKLCVYMGKLVSYYTPQLNARVAMMNLDGSVDTDREYYVNERYLLPVTKEGRL